MEGFASVWFANYNGACIGLSESGLARWFFGGNTTAQNCANLGLATNGRTGGKTQNIDNRITDRRSSDGYRIHLMLNVR